MYKAKKLCKILDSILNIRSEVMYISNEELLKKNNLKKRK